MSDDVIWHCIRHNHCSFMAKYGITTLLFVLGAIVLVTCGVLMAAPVSLQDYNRDILPESLQRDGHLQPELLPACQQSLCHHPGSWRWSLDIYSLPLLVIHVHGWHYHHLIKLQNIQASSLHGHWSTEFSTKSQVRRILTFRVIKLKVRRIFKLIKLKASNIKMIKLICHSDDLITHH